MQIYNTRRQRHVTVDADERPKVAHTAHRSTPREKSFLRRHLAFFSIIALAIAGTGLAIIAMTAADAARETKWYTEQQAADKAFRAKMAELQTKRLALAKEAEATARANQPFDETKYFTGLKTASTDCAVAGTESLTVVINKKNCFRDAAWKPADLVEVDGFLVQKAAAEPLKTMMSDAAAAGVNFELTSAYRSASDQKILYDANSEGSGQPADLTSARPGYSEHETGLAIDVKILDCALNCFGTTRRYAWLKENAANYGFIERYPASLGEITGYVHEPWHWRYVGQKTALDMKQKGIETLEMYFGVPGGDYYAA